MPIPKPPWLTIPSLVERWKQWNIHTDVIETYFINNMLQPSFICPRGLELNEVRLDLDDNGEVLEPFIDRNESEPADEGVYDILFYSKLVWSLNTSIHQKTTKLATSGVCLFSRKDKKYYSVTHGYTLVKDELIIAIQEVERFEADIDGAEKIHPDPTVLIGNGTSNKNQTKKRKFDGVTFKARSKAPITMVLDHMFETCESTNPAILEPGNREAFYNYLKNEVAIDAVMSNGKQITEYIDKIIASGTERGILMQHPKEGKKTGYRRDCMYSDTDISQRISRIRKKRKTPK